MWPLLIQEVGAQALQGAGAPRLAGVALRSLQAQALAPRWTGGYCPAAGGSSGCTRTELWGHFWGDFRSPAFLSQAPALYNQAATGWNSGLGTQLGVSRPPLSPALRTARLCDKPRAHHH